MRDSSLRNPKCTKTHRGRGFAPDRGDPWPTGGSLQCSAIP